MPSAHCISHFFLPPVNSSNYIGSIISVEKILRRTVSAKFQPILILPEKKKRGLQEGHEKQTIFGKRPDSCILFDNQGWWIEHKVVYFKAVHGVTSILANSKYSSEPCKSHAAIMLNWNLDRCSGIVDITGPYLCHQKR